MPTTTCSRPRRPLATACALIACLFICTPPAHGNPALAALVDAHTRGDEPAFVRLVLGYRGDPWWGVDDLLTAGKPAVAVAFAAARQDPDAAALRAYAEAGRRPSAEDRAAHDKAHERLRAGDPRGALAMLRKRAIAPDQVLFARIGYTRGMALQRLGRPGEAFQAYGEAADAARALGWLQLEYFARKMQRRLAAERGDEAGVLESQEQMVRVLLLRGPRQETARAQADLAGLLSELGDTTRSLDLLTAAHATFVELKAGSDAAMTAINAALVTGRRGEYGVAMAWLDEAQETSKAEQERTVLTPSERLRFVLVRSALYGELEKHDLAVTDLNTALALLPAGAREERRDVLLQLSFAHLQAARRDAALEALGAARDLLDPEKDRVELAMVARREAMIQHADGRSAAAATKLKKVLASVPPNTLWHGLTQLDLARVALARKQLAKARALAIQAAENLRTLRAHDALADAEGVLAEAYAASGAWREATDAAVRTLGVLDHVVAGLSDHTMARARARRSHAFEVGMAAAMHLEDTAVSVALLERWRSRALLDAWGGRTRLRGVGLPVELARAEHRASHALARARQSLGTARRRGRMEEVAEATEQVRRTTADLEEVQERIQRAAKRIAQLRRPPSPTVAEIQAGLAEDASLVYTTRVGNDIQAVVVTRTKLKRAKLCELAALQEAMAAFDGARDDPDEDAQARLDELRTLVGKGLPARGPLWICPERELCFVPWTALFPGRDVACIPSASVLGSLAPRGANASGPTLALGNPTYRDARRPTVPLYFRGYALRQLPEAGKEVLAVASRKGDVTLTEGQATEAALRDALEGRASWSAVLLSCHGLIDRDSPSLSALALSPEAPDDGFLSVFDVLGMRIPTDLVVASACDSGRGPVAFGEGVLGFARAFMVAGSSRVIVSLWPVDDESTRALMVEFFKHWRGGMGTAQALRAAQAHVRTQKGWEGPHHWAAWVLWGRMD